MKIFYKFIILLAWLILFLSIYVSLNWDRKHTAPYPKIKASNDSLIIARGKYLVFGPMHCAACHVPKNNVPDIDAGQILPLTGGWEFEIPPGTFRAANLTPDPETGIGNLKDEEIARVLRYSVAPDGSVLAPFMPYQDICDDDLTAIISFLRVQQPVKHEIKKTEYTLLGKALLAFGQLKSEWPKTTPLKTIVPDTSIEYGRYIVNSVAACKGCHTNRNMKTGEFIGPELAGGRLFKPNQYSNGYSFVPPNITPDPETGVMTSWSEDEFIKRFRSGRVYKGSPMFWGPYSRMNERDIRAVYNYLQSVKPVKNKVEKIVYKPGEKLPDIR